MAGDEISAVSMALAARFDPQFAVPHRPRIRRGVVLRRSGRQLLVDGAPTRHVLRGDAATGLLPRLVPLLDGARDHEALAAGCGVSPAEVFAALSLLWTCGVVEEASPSDVDVSGVAAHLADHLSRLGDSTAAHPAWESAAADLRAARLEVFGQPDLVAAILNELGETVPARAGAGGTVSAETTLVIRATVDGVGPDLDDLVARCWSAGRPLLRVDLTAATVEIGPLVDRAISPCLACQLATSGADQRPDAVSPSSPPTPPSRADDVGLAAAMAAADVVALVGRATPCPLPIRWRRINLDRMATSQRSGATRPGCPLCSARVTPTGEPEPTGLAARYEAAVALPPRRFADLKAHQMHYKPANVALQRGHRTWPMAPRTGLPEPKLERLADRPGATDVDLDAVSLLLMLGAGWREDRPERVQRWTASGGNIGSVTAYLVARRLDGLAAGVYGYLAPTHELALLRGPDAAFGPDGDAVGDNAPATLILTADLARVAHKYGAFGLRVVLLDGGCAQATVLAAADRYGLSVQPEPFWDDGRVVALLGLDPTAEPVTGVLRLRPTVGRVTIDGGAQ